MAERTVGTLHSELRIDLHTYYAISTWHGRDSSERKERIIGMPGFFRLVSNINRDSLADNPYADTVMYQLEKLIDEAHRNIKVLLDEVNSLIAALPGSISLSDVVSKSPLNIGVYSHTPIGYRCVYLLIGFDQLALRLFQAYHYGFISLKRRNRLLKEGGYHIRRIFTVAQRYRSFPVCRKDIATNTSGTGQAQLYFGDLDEGVLLGEKRSRFSPAINIESFRLLSNLLQRHAVGDINTSDDPL
ncbi:PFL_4669 family integrating conjugative element protein [Yersinia ruckeri]